MVDQIISLVTQQVSKVRTKGGNVKAILLVGGFGSSEYLFKRLSSHTYGGLKIEVLQPVNAYATIAHLPLLPHINNS